MRARSYIRFWTTLDNLVALTLQQPGHILRSTEYDCDDCALGRLCKGIYGQTFEKPMKWLTPSQNIRKRLLSHAGSLRRAVAVDKEHDVSADLSLRAATPRLFCVRRLCGMNSTVIISSI